MTNENKSFTATEKQLFIILSNLIDVAEYEEFMDECTFYMKTPHHQSPVEHDFHEWAAINNQNDFFGCPKKVLDHNYYLEVTQAIKAVLNILGEEGYLKFCLWHTSKSGAGALPDYNKF